MTLLAWSDNDENRSLAYITGLYQLILLAALAGIGRAIVRDAVAFVRPRTCTFNVPGVSPPREDPLVQQIVGRLLGDYRLNGRLPASPARRARSERDRDPAGAVSAVG